QFARESVFGVDAKTGEPLWKYSAANNPTANCFAPIVYDDHVFVSSGYGTGTGVVKIKTDGGKQSAEEVYFLKKLQSHHGGAVRIGDYVYSNGGGALMCIDYLTGDVAWEARSVGKGSLVAADGMLYVLSEGHQVALAEANPEKYVEHGRFKIESHGRPSWAHPVVAGGRLYLRDQGALTAYNVRP
ncbi:MAG: PQQ-binding-like beta-propeller repeat protein, partial [Planctomycetota bacterium]